MRLNLGLIIRYLLAVVICLLIGFVRLRQEQFTIDSKYNLMAQAQYVQEKLQSNTQGVLKRAYFSVGERFNKGDLMYEIDGPDLYTQLAEEKNKQQSTNTLQNIQRLQSDIDNLKIYAPFDGYIVKESADIGDTIGHGEELAKVTRVENYRTAIVLKDYEYNNLPVELKSLLKIGKTVELQRYTETTPTYGVIDDITETVKDKKTGRTEIDIYIKPNDINNADYKLTEAVKVFIPKQTLIKKVLASAKFIEKEIRK